MRVLVAGGDGFCGRPTTLYLWLLLALENRDYLHPETIDPEVSWRQPRYT